MFTKILKIRESFIRFLPSFHIILCVTCLEVLPGVKEGAPELPLFHGHDAAGVQHGQELRKLPDLEKREEEDCVWEGTQGTSRSRREQRKCFVS